MEVKIALSEKEKTPKLIMQLIFAPVTALSAPVTALSAPVPALSAPVPALSAPIKETNVLLKEGLMHQLPPELKEMVNQLGKRKLTYTISDMPNHPEQAYKTALEI